MKLVFGPVSLSKCVRKFGVLWLVFIKIKQSILELLKNVLRGRDELPYPQFARRIEVVVFFFDNFRLMF